jgi:hypothetical protein
MANEPSQLTPGWQTPQQIHTKTSAHFLLLVHKFPSPLKRFNLVRWGDNLTLVDRATLLTSLSGLVSFFLPWLSVPYRGNVVVNPGWRTAAGFPTPQIQMFTYLWLVLLSEAGEVIVVWLLGRQRLSALAATAMTITLSLVALLTELVFFVHVTSLHAYIHTISLPISGYNLFWGFWLAMPASSIILSANLWALLRSRQLGNLGIPRDERFNIARFWKNLGVSGQVESIASLALLLCFFLPWYATPDFTHSLTGGAGPFYSGWRTASAFSASPFLTFPQLWLIPLSVGGILIILWLLGGQRLSARLAAVMITTISSVVVLVQLGFFVQVLLLQAEQRAIFHTATTNFDVLGGFWLATAVSATMVATSIWALKLRISPTDIELSQCDL